MATLQAAYVHQAEIEAGIARAQSRLTPDVVRIRYSLGEDWTGDPSVFFRIVLSDEAARPSNLQEFRRKAKDLLKQETRAYEFDLNAYFNFRSESEQREMPEPDWN